MDVLTVPISDTRVPINRKERPPLNTKPLSSKPTQGEQDSGYITPILAQLADLTTALALYVEKDGDTMTGGLSIHGGLDEVQLLVRGRTAQTANIFEVEDSLAGNLFTIPQTGTISAFLPIIVDGASNVTQLTVQGAATQTVATFVVERSNGTDLFTIGESGGSGRMTLNGGNVVNEFSTDGTMAGNSNLALPTEAAVKTYADTKVADTGDTMTGALFIDGGVAGAIQLQVQAHASQSVDVVTVESSAGTDWFRIRSTGQVSLTSGADINEFSTDGTLSGNSDDAVPTEQAVKTYVDTNAPRPLKGSNTAASSAIANTDVETNFSLTHDITANSLAAGDVVHIRASGLFSTDAFVIPTLRFKVKFDSTTLVDLGAYTLAGAGSSHPWIIDLNVHVWTIGATGTAECTGTIQLTTASGTVYFPLYNTSTITIDTTQALTTAVSAQWGAADTDNTITMRTLNVYHYKKA